VRVDPKQMKWRNCHACMLTGGLASLVAGAASEKVARPRFTRLLVTWIYLSLRTADRPTLNRKT
jgi:hypothetical protein